MSDKVLLFAHPRSGSSSLFQILDLHPKLRILEEPFNENYANLPNAREIDQQCGCDETGWLFEDHP